MELDQFMKELVVDFIVDVMTLFFPCLAEQLDFAKKRDLNKELYTTSPSGKERFVDVLLEVRFKSPPPEILLIHFESQQQKRFDLSARMLAYQCLIYTREIEGKRRDSFSLSEFTEWQNHSRILSFVFCNYLLQDSITQEEYQIGLPQTCLIGRYTGISLPLLSARKYLQKDNPVVCALAVFMNADGFSLPELKVACYRKLLSYLSNLTRRQINQIVYAVETYLNLSEEEEQVYQRMISEVYPEVSKMVTNPLIEQGRKQGIQQGIQQGIRQGMQQGIQQGKQSILIQLLDEKFGKIPESMKNQIREITDENLLDQLSLRILRVNSLDEMELDGKKNSN